MNDTIRITLVLALTVLPATLACGQSPAPSPDARPVSPASGGGAAASPTSPAPTSGGSASPRAAEVAAEVMRALGGEEAWNATRFLRFDFGTMRDGALVARAHTWDRHTGRYRLESRTREGVPYLALMNVDTRQGQAWLDGARATGEQEKALLEQAYATWVNDTYWLLMPYKLRDPGVVLGDGGKKPCGTETCDVLELSFENVGLTPKDRYWVYVNTATRLVDRWDFVLKGETTPPTSYLWEGWSRHGRIMLASERENTKDGRKILFPVLAAPESIDDAVFTSPEARLMPPPATR